MRLHPPIQLLRFLLDAAPHRAGWNFIAACGALLVLTSCINSQNTRFPTLYSGGAEYERNQAAIQDPYPDSIAGPDTGFRPNEFAQERPEPTRAPPQGRVDAGQ